MELKLSIKIKGLKKIKKTFKFGDLLKLVQGLTTEVKGSEDFFKMFKG